MKKLITVAFLVVMITVSGWSQEMSPNAIGLKFGGGAGSYRGAGVTFSYQKALSDINRVELNLGISSRSYYTHFNVGGFYQWVHDIQDGWSWYIGPGASIGSVSIKDGDDRFFLGVAGQVGLEYRFTLDVNPYIGLLNGEGLAIPVQLGVRYMF